MTLSEALNQYLASQASGAQAFEELHRFVRWAGLERRVEVLRPPEVAAYAEGVVSAGGDVQSRLTQVKEFLSFLNKRGVLAQRLAPHIKIPKLRRGPALEGQRSVEGATITAATHEALQRELQALKDHRVVIAEKLRTAAADKDFRENAPLDAAREEQGKMEGRIREIEAMLRHAVVVEPGAGPTGKAQVGSHVTLHDLSSGKEVSYTLVDSSEADPFTGKLSVASPVGKAIVGSAPGDEVDVVAPKGVLRYRVAAVEG